MPVSRAAHPLLSQPTTRTLQQAHAETLSILTESLPHLRAGNSSQESAERVAALVLERPPVQAVAIVNTDQVLAFYGAGSHHHQPGQPFVTDLTRDVLRTGETGHGQRSSRRGLSRARLPVDVRYRSAAQATRCSRWVPQAVPNGRRHDGPGEMEVARSLARIFSAHLELAELDAQRERIAQAELEALRAQISPHFLVQHAQHHRLAHSDQPRASARYGDRLRGVLPRDAQEARRARYARRGSSTTWTSTWSLSERGWDIACKSPRG